MLSMFHPRRAMVSAITLLLACIGVARAETPTLPTWTIEELTANGGRLAWYTGPEHELIAYDAVVDPRNAATEVFVMQADGSQARCITCTMHFPKGAGFVGQPAWYPDGKHLVIQVENANSRHTRFNHMSWGIDADLWLISIDGARAERIWASAAQHAALHPHFSDDGRLLVFSERLTTPRVTRRPFHPWAVIGGQNPWDGWAIHIATVDVQASGTSVLVNHRRIMPNGSGFYETHSISSDGRIVYSHTGGGAPYVDAIFETGASGLAPRQLIANPQSWDEHGAFAPNGRSLAFISSRADAGWRAPDSRPDTLTTELFLRSVDGRIHQLTAFNERANGGKRYLVSDFDWDRSGQRIAFQLAPIPGSGKPDPAQIWLLRISSP